MDTRISYKQKALKLVRKKGIARSSELVREGIPKVVISRLTAENKLEKMDRGIYCLPGTDFSEKEELVIVAKRAPQAVFCLLSALQIHGVTTQLPRKIWIAMPKGSHAPQIEYPPIKMVKYSGDAYSEGISIIRADKSEIRVYNLAKTIADCFKHRNKIGLDVAIEALKDAKTKVVIDELWYYAKICRVTNVMRPYLEVIR